MGTRSWRRECGGALVALFFGLFFPHPSIGAQNRGVADSSCAALTNEATRWADDIVLLPVDVPTTRVTEAAIKRWMRCSEYAIAFPRFVLGAGRGRRVTVEVEEHSPGLGYCGLFAGQRIVVHRRVRVNDGRIIACPPLERVVAHELGHVLGLRDVAAREGCSTVIMSEVVEDRPPLQRVASGECRAADRKWMTSQEREVERRAGNDGW